MRNFDFNGMNDDEFRREFMRFLTMYQSGLEDFMKKNYSEKNFTSNPFFNTNNIFDDSSLKDLFKMINFNDMNIEKGDDENGEWEKRSWNSPDGNSYFSSFSRNSYFNPFEDRKKSEGVKDWDKMDTIKLLERKLNEAIMNEKYESAAKIRDLINNLKEDKKKESKN